MNFSIFYIAVYFVASIMSADSSTCPDIKFNVLSEKLANKEIVLIDVRNPNELEENGFIPGSFNIPLPTLAETLALNEANFKEKMGFPKPQHDAAVVVSCMSGRRAKLAEPQFANAGYTNIMCYLGSFNDWKSNNGQIVFKQ